MIKGLIFDLDGVLVDTARFHYIAWKKLANELGFDISQEQNEKLKGISRVDSLNRILKWGNMSLSPDELQSALHRKNNHYLQLCNKLTPADCLPGILEFLADSASHGLQLGVGSASRNARPILQKLQIISFFDHVVDGNMTTKGKPDPEVFLKGAEAMHLEPWEVIVFEDAEMGIEAAHKGGFFSVGVGNSEVLDGANYVIDGFEQVNITDLITYIQA